MPALKQPKNSTETDMITKTQAVNLKHGDILHMPNYFNADGTPQRWRVNGQVKTWKTMPDRFKVPLARGMYEHCYLREDNADWFVIPE